MGWQILANNEKANFPSQRVLDKTEMDQLVFQESEQKSVGIRDPIHQWIEVSPEEKLVIDSPYVQRLRRLSQLGLVSFVFPGAVNNRFMHSLGVMHLAGQYGQLLFSKDDPQRDLCIRVLRLAGLLHDIAHGPFSHTWDKTIYSRIYPKEEKGHDCHRLALIQHPPFAKLLQSAGIEPKQIIQAWTEEPFKSILQGPMGADRLDYMLRDAYFTGTQHFGTVALDRILNNSFLKEGQLCFRPKIKDEIQRALEGRTYLYHNVYEHKTVKEFEGQHQK